jgi:hypothetical protein
MAIPTSAVAKAGASLTPSPTMATADQGAVIFVGPALFARSLSQAQIDSIEYFYRLLVDRRCGLLVS